MNGWNLYYQGRFFNLSTWGEVSLLERDPNEDQVINGRLQPKWKKLPISWYDDESTDAGLKLELEFQNHGITDIVRECDSELRDSIIAEEMIRCAVDYKHETELKESNYVRQYGDLDYSYTANDGAKFQVTYDNKRLSHQLRFEVKVTFNDDVKRFQLSFRDYKWFVSQIARLRAR